MSHLIFESCYFHDIKFSMENWSFIENQSLLKTVFKTPPVISYRRGKSLKPKADFSSVSPLSERIEELWLYVVYIQKDGATLLIGAW